MPDNDIDKVFQRHGFFISRETLEKLIIYQRLLHKWQPVVNLVGPATLEDAATRHFFDSAQVFRYVTDPAARLVDIGSGAGFPGMILAMLGATDVHLVESDVRKATFLREVSRETKTSVTIHDVRAEDCNIEGIRVLTARALAPLRDLLRYTQDMKVEGYSLFMKGMQYQEEIDKARKAWNFEAEIFPSMTEMAGRIVKVTQLSKK